nr:site-specific integrase [Vibrio mediterranei]
MKFKKTRRDSEAKQAYSHADLYKIFNTPIHTKQLYKHSHYYWLPLLGYFTGARLNELCQLYKSDVLMVDGTWVIRINDLFEGQKVKNAFSRRFVPVHSKLLELGFIEYMKGVHHERLFPELKNQRDGFGSAASKWFGRFKSKLGFNRGHDFHSFRHTVATQFKKKGVNAVSAGEVLGHAQNNITYDRYGKGIDISTMSDTIELIDSSVIPKAGRS